MDFDEIDLSMEYTGAFATWTTRIDDTEITITYRNDEAGCPSGNSLCTFFEFRPCFDGFTFSLTVEFYALNSIRGILADSCDCGDFPVGEMLCRCYANDEKEKVYLVYEIQDALYLVVSVQGSLHETSFIRTLTPRELYTDSGIDLANAFRFSVRDCSNDPVFRWDEPDPDWLA